MQRLLPLGLLFLPIACGEKTPDGQVNADAAVNADATSGPMGPTFASEVVDGLNTDQPAGDNVQLALDPGGQLHAVYGVVPPNGKYELWHAARGTDGTWTKELVTRPGSAEPSSSGQIKGLGFTFVGAVPHVVFLGGTGDNRPLTPYPTDLVLATKTGAAWSERTLVVNSGDAQCTCIDQADPLCNFGNVVGSDPGIAAAPNGAGFAVSYRDTHGGFAETDLSKSDVEIYSEGLAPAVFECVDPEVGAGANANVVFARSGGLVVAYNRSTQTGFPTPVTGVWAAARDGATWTKTKVSTSQATSKIALGAASDGTIYLAFAGDQNELLVSTSSDEGRTWSAAAAVDTEGKTGLAPSLGFDAAGRPVISYVYCGKAGDRDCPGTLGADARIRLARLEGSTWQRYDIDDGRGFGKVGKFTALVRLPDGKLGVAFNDAANNDLVFTKEQ